MRCVLKREPMLAALQLAAAVVPTNGSRPSLRCALLAPDADGRLSVQATDLELAVRYALTMEAIDVPTALCLPATVLYGVLASASEDVLTLEANGTKAVLTCGRDRFELLGCAADDFPPVPDVPSPGGVQIQAAALLAALDRVIFCAAKEQGRYAINGIFLKRSGQTLLAVATDGRRLAVFQQELKGAADSALDAGVIVPLPFAQELARLAKSVDANEVLRLTVDARRVVAVSTNAVLSSLLIEGMFPNWEKVVPSSLQFEATLHREAALKALTKAGYLTSDETHAVTLQFSAGRVTVLAAQADMGSACVLLDCDYEGPELRVMFRLEFLREPLKVLSSERIRLQFTDPEKASVVVDDGFKYVLMPMSAKE